MNAVDCGLCAPVHWNIVSLFFERIQCLYSVLSSSFILLNTEEVIQIQRPSLWIIDMNTEKVVQRFEIPESVIEPGRGIISLNVDVNSKTCDNAYAYISDFLTESLLVYR